MKELITIIMLLTVIIFFPATKNKNKAIAKSAEETAAELKNCEI